MDVWVYFAIQWVLTYFDAAGPAEMQAMELVTSNNGESGVLVDYRSDVLGRTRGTLRGLGGMRLLFLILFCYRVDT